METERCLDCLKLPQPAGFQCSKNMVMLNKWSEGKKSGEEQFSSTACMIDSSSINHWNLMASILGLTKNNSLWGCAVVQAQYVTLQKFLEKQGYEFRNNKLGGKNYLTVLITNSDHCKNCMQQPLEFHHGIVIILGRNFLQLQRTRQHLLLLRSRRCHLTVSYDVFIFI